VYAANAPGSPPPVSDSISEIEKGKSGMKESVINGDSSLGRTEAASSTSNLSRSRKVAFSISSPSVVPEIRSQVSFSSKQQSC
jgi:hypothetical protein